MSNPFRRREYDEPQDDDARFPPLPGWIARRTLKNDEEVEWVRGPRHNPSWEWAITHPAMFLAAVALAGAAVTIGRLALGSGSEFVVVVALAVAFLFVWIFVLALSNAYFTRLVVTSQRLIIFQGIEICRQWGMDDLPPSLTRYGRRRDGMEKLSIDLSAVQNMLGGSPDGFVDAKTILDLGKNLDRIKRGKRDA